MTILLNIMLKAALATQAALLHAARLVMLWSSSESSESESYRNIARVRVQGA